MAPEAGPVRTLSFGPFRLDLDAALLERHGAPVRIGRQPILILARLAQRPGEVVTRDQLREDLWGADTFVDFEHGLNAAINKLRQALGDSADRPRFIETLPGRGYRFLAAVRSEPAVLSVLAEPPAPLPPPELAASQLPASADSARPTAEPVPLTHRRNRFVPFAVLIAAALIIPAALWLALFRRPSTLPLRPMQFTISAPDGFAFQPAGARQSFAISPDGSRLAFVAMGEDGQFRLWVRDLAHLEPREIVAAKGLHTVFWSPPGDFLYFGIDRSLRRVSPEPGAAPQIIADLPRRVPPTGTWLSPESVLLSYRQLTVTVPPAGGRARTVPEAYLWPQMLPDGRNLLFLSYDAGINRFHLRAGHFGSPESVNNILETDSRVTWVQSTRTPGRGYLLYVQAGSLLAQPFDPQRLRLTGEAVLIANPIHVFQPTGAADFSVSTNGVLVYQPISKRSHIGWVDRTGRELERVGPENLAVVYARASLNGRNVAASVYNPEEGGSEIWIYDAASKLSRVFAPGPGVLDMPVWAPDATRLVYSRALGGGPRLFMRGLAEQEPEQRLPQNKFQLATDWSQDGRWLLFNTEITTDGNLGVIDMKTQRLSWLLEGPANEMSPAFSPDGRWVAFISNESGRPEAYVQAFEGGERPKLTGERTRVSSDGAQLLRWRGDGREICYLGTDGVLQSVPVKMGARPQFGSPVPLFRIPVAWRAALPSAYGFDVAPDGSRFLLPAVRGLTVSSLVVIQNWESLLDRH